MASSNKFVAPPTPKLFDGRNQSVVTQGLKWEGLNLSVTVGRGKNAVKRKLLNNISGYANRGEITAIMGPSGSGKTSLINVLTGRLGPGDYDLDGKITFEGSRRQPSTWKNTTAFVEQEDLMYDCLTVEETIIFSAMMRLPSTYTKAQKIERARNVISILGLSKVRNTEVGSHTKRGVSGGERKRCAVGVELVTSPKLMVLDEPTSGLDSQSAYNVVSTARDVARQGVAVLCTIHQPAYDLFSMFDKLLLIVGGRVAFHGSIPEAIDHFTRIGYPVQLGANAADHFVSILTEDVSSEPGEEKMSRVQNMIDIWADTAPRPTSMGVGEVTGVLRSQSHDDGSNSGFALGFFEEFWWLTRRAWIQTIRDKQKILAPFFASTFVGLILAFTFFRLGDGQTDVIGKAGLIFFLPVNISFGTLIPIISYLPLLNGILTRERSTGAYRVSTFYLSRYVIEVPFAILGRIIFFVLVYWVCGLRPQAGPFFIYMGINWLTVLFSVALGMFIGSVSKNLAVVQTITPSLNVVFLLFGGFLLPLGSVPKWFVWVYWSSYLRYVFGGLCINEFKGRTLDCQDSQTCFHTGDDFLDAYDLNTFGIGVNVALLVALIGVFAILGYVMLRKLTNPRLRLDI